MLIATLDKSICFQCIQESYLSKQIQHENLIGDCDYCSSKAVPCWRLENVINEVDSVIEQYYQLSLNEPPHWGDSGDPIYNLIANLLDLSAVAWDDAAEDIRATLNKRYLDKDSMHNPPFGLDSCYEEKGVNPCEISYWDEQWNRLESLLKHESRFFSGEAKGILDSIFNGLDKQALQEFTHEHLIHEVGPGCEVQGIYRARFFETEDSLAKAIASPARQLGPPPTDMASAGRMNAHGIAVFYGADSPETAIAEVRPPVGAMVAVTEFRFLRPLRLLDFSALRHSIPGSSLFDSTFQDLADKVAFLHTLEDHISRVVTPKHEKLEYITTQVIADYLANHEDLNLDGVVFPSVQASKGAKNYVLFHKAARVRDLRLLERYRLELDRSQFDEFERVVKVKKKETKTESSPLLDDYDPDPRTSTLRLKVRSITVNDVRCVQYKSSPVQLRFLKD